LGSSLLQETWPCSSCPRRAAAPGFGTEQLHTIFIHWVVANPTGAMLATFLGSLLCQALAHSPALHGLAADDECQQMGLSLLQMQRDEVAKGKSQLAVETSASARRALKQGACGNREMPAVFVVSTGRSGSTSALHMLNEIPGYDIKGENQGMWQTLMTMVDSRDEAYEHYGPADIYSWTRSEARNRSEFLCGLQLMVLGELNPKADAKVVGFKEIRWNFEQNLTDLELLLEVFPSAKVVLNFRRDIEAQIESMKSTSGDFETQSLVEETRAIKGFYAKHSDRSYMLRLEDFTVDTFNDMLHWLGEDEKCKYVAVADDNSDNGYTTSVDKSSQFMKCRN